jgi:hypothetical protein
MLNNPLIKIAIAPFAVLILHIIATITGLYEMLWWLDIPLHFLGGVAIALGSYYLLQDFGNRKLFAMQSAPLKILTLLAFTALAAVSWEFLEFSLDRYAGTTMQPGVLDTIKDLAFGLSGGGMGALLILTRSFKNKNP